MGFHGDTLPEHGFVWIIAFDAFDYGDSGPLEEVLRSEQPIPPEIRPTLAEIVSGRRRPNLKAAAKLKVPASERMKIAGALSTVLGLIDSFKFDEHYDLAFGLDAKIQGRLYNIQADKDGVDPSGVIRHLEAEAANIIQETARDLEVSNETIENLLRDLRKKIREYPNI